MRSRPRRARVSPIGRARGVIMMTITSRKPVTSSRRNARARQRRRRPALEPLEARFCLSLAVDTAATAPAAPVTSTGTISETIVIRTQSVSPTADVALPVVASDGGQTYTRIAQPGTDQYYTLSGISAGTAIYVGASAGGTTKLVIDVRGADGAT